MGGSGASGSDPLLGTFTLDQVDLKVFLLCTRGSRRIDSCGEKSDQTLAMVSDYQWRLFASSLAFASKIVVEDTRKGISKYFRAFLRSLETHSDSLYSMGP